MSCFRRGNSFSFAPLHKNSANICWLCRKYLTILPEMTIYTTIKARDSNKGQQVMLDADLAEIYGYEVKRLNEQVKRNLDRFPEDSIEDFVAQYPPLISISCVFYLRHLSQRICSVFVGFAENSTAREAV